MTVAKYLRISDEDADMRSSGKEESSSIANQRDLLDSFIAEHTEFAGADIVEFCDDGWSGKNFERPGVRAMLEQVRRGNIQCIVVKDMSRFGRDYLTVGKYISKIFPFMGVRFIAVNDGLDSARPGDVDSLGTSFKALLYDIYSRDLSRKVKNAKRFRAKRGDFVAPFAPYGYMKSPENHNRLVIDPPAAEIVRRIFSLAAKGYSAVSVARMMNDEAVLTPMLYKRAAGCSRTRWPSIHEDNFWTDRMVSKILRDEQYLGAVIYGKRIRDKVGSTHTVKVSPTDQVKVEGAHEGIVTPEEFERAQKAMRKFKEHRRPAKPYPLAGKIYCGICGHVLTRSRGKEKQYFCETPRFMGKSGCLEVNVPQADLRGAVLASLRTQAAVALDMEKFMAEQRKVVQLYAGSALKRLAALKRAQEKNNREGRGLYESFVLGGVSKAEFLAKKAAMAEKKAKTAEQIAELQNSLDLQAETGDGQFVENILHFFEAQDVPDEVLRELLKEVRVFPGGRMEIAWAFPDDLIGEEDAAK